VRTCQAPCFSAPLATLDENLDESKENNCSLNESVLVRSIKSKKARAVEEQQHFEESSLKKLHKMEAMEKI